MPVISARINPLPLFAYQLAWRIYYMISLFGKTAVIGNTGKRRRHCSRQIFRLKTNNLKRLLVFAGWNHTLLDLAPRAPKLCQIRCTLPLKMALTSAFPTAVSVWSSNKHFTAANRIFNAGPALMKETRVTERWRKSAWRIENPQLPSISDSNAAITL